jgi:NAD-dependent deacetylase sirtuin 2
MGTSLAVQPFASLVDHVSETTPRLLINREKCGQRAVSNVGNVLDLITTEEVLKSRKL